MSDEKKKLAFSMHPSKPGYYVRAEDGAAFHRFSREVVAARAAGTVEESVQPEAIRKREQRKPGTVAQTNVPRGTAPEENPHSPTGRAGRGEGEGETETVAPPPPGPKVTRPPSSPPPKKTAKTEAKELGVLIGITFSGIAMVRGPHWQISEDESGELGAALTACVPTLPAEVVKRIKSVTRYMPFVNLALVGVNIVVPRIAMDAKLAAAAAEARRPKLVPQPQPQPQPQAQNNGARPEWQPPPVPPEVPGLF